MAKINNSKNSLFLVPDNLKEAMNLAECFKSDVNPTTLSWHSLVTGSIDRLTENQTIQAMDSWGITIDDESMNMMESIYRSKKKTYLRGMRSLSEWRNTEAFKIARQRVEALFGKPMKDGRVLFPYQLDLAAFIICVRRVLNAMSMGLGKTISTIVGLASDPTIKLSLIITMSRNINDWVRELELLGFEENKDFIILKHPSDLKKTDNVQFHIVSYEKWSSDRITFRTKIHTECPHCQCGEFFNPLRQYCSSCKKGVDQYKYDSAWSDKDQPNCCPVCSSEWKKGSHFCNGEHSVNHNGIEEVQKCTYSIIEKRIPSLSHYYHRGYDAVAVDEAHYIKNADTRRAKSILKLRARTKVLLTGTPAESEVTDLFWLLGWLTGFSTKYEDPIASGFENPKPFSGFGKVGLENFRSFYGGGSKRRVLDVDSVEARVGHHEKLWQLLDTVMFRKRKTDEDVQKLIEVPEPKHIRYHLDLLPAERELYDLLVEEFRNWYESEAQKKEAAESRGEKYRIDSIQICSWMDKLRKAASCPWIFPDYDVLKGSTTGKLQYIENKVMDFLRRGKKVLLFSGHKETIEQLKLTLNEIIPGRKAEYIHGEVPMEYRWKVMKQFQDSNDPLSVLIMSHRTGAESYTLTEAKGVIIVDLDFNGKVRPVAA